MVEQAGTVYKPAADYDGAVFFPRTASRCDESVVLFGYSDRLRHPDGQIFPSDVGVLTSRTGPIHYVCRGAMSLIRNFVFRLVKSGNVPVRRFRIDYHGVANFIDELGVYLSFRGGILGS